MTVTIYHNPSCNTSRKVLALIRSNGDEPVIVEYLKHPPSRHELVGLIRRMGVSPRSLLRRKGGLYDELKLADPAMSDDRVIDTMLAHPILIERPIVVSPKGVRLCRPAENVVDLLSLG